MLTRSGVGFAGRIWIAIESISARTDGYVIGHTTLGIDSACVRTRIDAVVLFASFVARTIGIQQTLRTARRERVAHIVTWT